MTYRIAEVAERTGFSAPTLRYYEEIGLLRPAARTPAGYRIYDDRAIERLRFVARAKRLGCTLEEIADLADAWERDDCAPVQHRLRGLVAGKLVDVEARLGELLAFQAELRAAAAVLEGAPLDGPCDETCGCVAEPIACTIRDDEVDDRIAVIERLRAAATSVERTETGLALRFPADDADVEADVRRFAVDEKRCCAFWELAVVEEADTLVLRWDGPAAAGPLLDRLDALLRTDEPVELLRGAL